MGSDIWPSIARWQFGSAAQVVTIIALTLLTLCWRRTELRQRCLLALGFLLLIVLLASDIQAKSMLNYPSHMMEHVLITLVIAPFFAAAIGIPFSRSSATLGFLALTILVPLFHLTRLGAFVMQQSGGHDFELVSFLFVGVWFWLPIYGTKTPLTDYQRTMYLIIATPIIGATGLALLASQQNSMVMGGIKMAAVGVPDIHAGGVVMLWGALGLLVQGCLVGLLTYLKTLRAIRPIGQRAASGSPLQE
jgi:cytochrome c oxidase assembly factor CtaG